MEHVHAHGAEIPELGYGTFRMSDAEAEEGVRDALEIGYRHVDTAQIYENEKGVGAGIERSPVDRDEIFLTTKVWPDNFAGQRLVESVDESLRRLRTDYVDLLLLHWPKFEVPMAETVEALNQVAADGKARHIGVSNFTTEYLGRALELTEAPLVTNQVEYHPYLSQAPILEAVRGAGMSLTAYSPLAKGHVADDETLAEIGERHGKTAAQVGLRWLIQQEDVIAIPKAASAAHRRSNFDLFDFELSGEEMEEIHGLARTDGRIVDPDSVAPEWDDPVSVG